MREKEYHRLRFSLEGALAAAESRVSELRKDLEALERVRAAAGRFETTPSDSGEGEPVNGRSSHEGPRTSVLEAVLGMEAEFTSADVRNRVPGVHKSTVFNVLRDLEGSGRVVVVEPGQGRRPTRFKPAVQNGTARHNGTHVAAEGGAM